MSDLLPHQPREVVRYRAVIVVHIARSVTRGSRQLLLQLRPSTGVLVPALRQLRGVKKNAFVPLGEPVLHTLLVFSRLLGAAGLTLLSSVGAADAAVVASTTIAIASIAAFSPRFAFIDSLPFSCVVSALVILWRVSTMMIFPPAGSRRRIAWDSAALRPESVAGSSLFSLIHREPWRLE